MAGLEASNGLLHVFGIVPSEVRNERLIGVLLFGGAEDATKAGVPRLHIVERGIVPRVVGHREERRLRDFALLHGV